MTNSGAVVTFPQTVRQVLPYRCSACGADRGCDCNAPAIEKAATALARSPEKSDRAIAKELGVDHKTVAKARREAESTGEVSPVEKRVGADGKERKTKTPRQRKIAQNKKRQEEHAQWVERRRVFEDEVHHWVKSLGAEEAEGLQSLLEEDEFTTDKAADFVFVKSLEKGIEFNLTGVRADCWRIQIIKEERRRGNLLYFTWKDAKQYAAFTEEKIRAGRPSLFRF